MERVESAAAIQADKDRRQKDLDAAIEGIKELRKRNQSWSVGEIVAAIKQGRP